MRKLSLSDLSFVLLTSIIASSAANAQYVSEVLDRKTHTYSNENCEQTNSCDLKTFEIKVYKMRSKHGSDPFDYRVAMEGYYETDTVDNIENYAIVQYIKGSVVETGTGDEEFTRFPFRTYFGERWYKFNHPDWQIDSIDTDPIYASFIHDGVVYRHGAYQINPAQGSLIFDDIPVVFYFNEKPTIPRLYFSDLPSGSHIGNYYVRESKLKFKTCIYKTSEVPMDLGPDDTDFAQAISCFEWDGIFPYNPQTGSFDIATEL